jgi:hypothetical protein
MSNKTPDEIEAYKVEKAVEKAAEFDTHKEGLEQYQRENGGGQDYSDLEQFMPKDKDGQIIGCGPCTGERGCCPTDDFDDAVNEAGDANTPETKTAKAPPPPPDNIKKGPSLI